MYQNIQKVRIDLFMVFGECQKKRTVESRRIVLDCMSMILYVYMYIRYCMCVGREGGVVNRKLYFATKTVCVPFTKFWSLRSVLSHRASGIYNICNVVCRWICGTSEFSATMTTFWWKKLCYDIFLSKIWSTPNYFPDTDFESFKTKYSYELRSLVPRSQKYCQ